MAVAQVGPDLGTFSGRPADPAPESSVVSGAPLLFASLGPTAYEQIEKPELRSARFYNVVVGHWIGLGCGFLGIAFLDAWNSPKPMMTGHFDAARVGADRKRPGEAINISPDKLSGKK